MVYEIKVGVIKPDKLRTWNENHEPFDILDNPRDINNIDWTEFLAASQKLFTEKVTVDWGSFAFKATKDQLKQLAENYNAKIAGLDGLPDENLGVVFIEMS